MRFHISHKGTVIGESDLDRLDPAMGIAVGMFVPSQDYPRVLEVFGIADAVDDKTDHRSLTNDLVVKTATGVLVPTAWVRIEDVSAVLGADGREITVSALDEDAFLKYFANV
jgi:predicted glycosyltransferase